MKNLMLKRFAFWYGTNRKNKISNYLKNNFNNDILLFEEKLEEISNQFYKNYNEYPFDFDINNSKSIEDKLNSVKAKLAIKAKDFVDYNKKFGNGIPHALLGKNNYLAYLSDLLVSDNEKIEYSPFLLRKEFVLYLINEENYSSGSAKDYASYVSSANNYILKERLKIDFFGRIQRVLYESKEADEIEDLLDVCISEVTKNKEIKNKNKYKAGLVQYKEFLLNLLEEEESSNKVTTFTLTMAGNTVLNESNNNDFILTEIDKEEFSEFVIDKDTLISNFKFRMITQDRLYGDVYFPVRLLKKIFYQNKFDKDFFDFFILNQIEEIKIFISKTGDFIKLKDILGISIINKNVFVETEFESRLIYTELSNEGDFDVLSVSKLREIAIDHIIPMKTILLEFKHDLKGLCLLTSLLKNKGINKSGKESIKQLAIVGNEIIDNDLLLIDDIKLIRDDFNFLLQKLDLQLMSSKENLGKNNR